MVKEAWTTPVFKNPEVCCSLISRDPDRRCGGGPTAPDPTHNYLAMCERHWGQGYPVDQRMSDIVEKQTAPVREAARACFHEAVGKAQDKTVFNGDEFPYHEEVRIFVDAMKYKMMKNRHKGKWEDLDPKSALDLLKREVGELEKAITAGNGVDVLLEGADVAVFALIVTHIALVRGGARAVRP